MSTCRSSGEMPEAVGALKPSPLWGLSIAAIIALALVSGVIAVTGSVQAQRLIGEGELLYNDTARAAGILDTLPEGSDLDTELRRIRNGLEIDAVSVVSSDGSVVGSTSSTLIGLTLQGLLASSVENGRFVAVAASLRTELLVDGVVEWHPGDVLYQAVHPTRNGAVMLTYDLAELLRRRAAASRVRAHVVPLAVMSGVLMLVAAGLAVGRSRTVTVRREMTLESDFLRRQSQALQEHNNELEMARAETEAALGLAEEKNRIRSEFVLMINHELRTPLTGVVTGARLLAGANDLSSDGHQLVDDMIRDGERLESIIDQMLAVARVENRGLEVVPVEIRLTELMARLERAHRLVDFRVDPDLMIRNPALITDPTTLAQLVAGLADNALTHGATRVHVAVTQRLPDTPHLVVGSTPAHAIHVVVMDDGPGIDHEFLTRAFDKFAKSSRSSGTGLGLHFSKMMAESIFASISVHTTERGTWMAVGIPVVLASVESLREAMV